jgi:hypothetical protein
MAFLCDKEAEVGEMLLVEFSLPAQAKPLRVFSQIVHAGWQGGGDKRMQLRVNFMGLEFSEKQLLRLHVLEKADPRLAAISGWGQAQFQSMPDIEAAYRELAGDEQKKWLDERAYITLKEATYLKNFQAFLESRLGNKAPENFKIIGTRVLKDNAAAWVELNIDPSPIQVLAKVLWGSQEAGERARLGLNLIAFHKERALQIEKGH